MKTLEKKDMMTLYMSAVESAVRMMRIAARKYSKSSAIINHARREYAQAVKVFSDYIENRVKNYQ